MSYWDIKKKVDKLVEAHLDSRKRNRVLPWWNRDEFILRGQTKREKKQLKKEYWKNWRELDDDKD